MIFNITRILKTLHDVFIRLFENSFLNKVLYDNDDAKKCNCLNGGYMER